MGKDSELLLRERMMVDRPVTWAYDHAGPYADLANSFRLQGERNNSGRGPRNVDTGGPNPHGRRNPAPGDKPPGATKTPAPESFTSLAQLVSAFGKVTARKSGLQYCMHYNWGGESHCTHELDSDGNCKSGDGGQTKRLHKCVRCGQSHQILGKGKCDHPNKIR